MNETISGRETVICESKNSLTSPLIAINEDKKELLYTSILPLKSGLFIDIVDSYHLVT
ncbi:hypothetical protein D3C77_614830 [compost metagenome]